jgi:hypothetical protein
MNPQIAAGALRPHSSWEGAARPRIPRKEWRFAPGAIALTFKTQRGNA